jgi:hypothetical protein
MRLIFCNTFANNTNNNNNNNKLSSVPSLQTDCGTYQASIAMDNLVVSPGDIAAVVNLQPPSCVEVESAWSSTSAPTYAFIACAGTNFYLPRRVKYLYEVRI